MIADYKITKPEEMELLHNLANCMSKQLDKPLHIYYYGNTFKIGRVIAGIDKKTGWWTNVIRNPSLEKKLNKNIKDIISEEIYNLILINASLENNPLWNIIIDSSGYDIIKKLAHCIYVNQSSPYVEPFTPVTQTIYYKHKKEQSDRQQISDCYERRTGLAN